MRCSAEPLRWLKGRERNARFPLAVCFLSSAYADAAPPLFFPLSLKYSPSSAHLCFSEVISETSGTRENSLCPLKWCWSRQPMSGGTGVQEPKGDGVGFVSEWGLVSFFFLLVTIFKGPLVAGDLSVNIQSLCCGAGMKADYYQCVCE